jgi:hypothetical protein
VEPLAARQSTPALAAAFRSILPRPVICYGSSVENHVGWYLFGEECQGTK